MTNSPKAAGCTRIVLMMMNMSTTGNVKEDNNDNYDKDDDEYLPYFGLTIRIPNDKFPY